MTLSSEYNRSDRNAGHVDHVDENPHDGDGTYLYQTCAAGQCATQNPAEAYFRMADPAVSMPVVTSITCFAVAKQVGSGGTIDVAVSLGAPAWGGARLLTANYSQFSTTITSHPVSGNPLTIDDVEDASCGVQTEQTSPGANDLRVTQIRMRAEYDDGVPTPTPTATPTPGPPTPTPTPTPVGPSHCVVYDVPSFSILPGTTTSIPITLTNCGTSTWSPAQDDSISYHWYDEGNINQVEWDGLRTLLPTSVPPGQTVSFDASVRA